MSDDHARQLRIQAHRLRELSDDLEHTPLLRLHHHAGTDTWRGPRADFCLGQLRAAQGRIHQAADDLRWQAWQCDQRADELDRLAALRPDTAS